MIAKHQKHNKYHDHPVEGGFTLVEILIVIVVMGILALIVYLGSQAATTYAQNASRLQGANDARKALVNYFTTNSKYPSLPLPSANVCIAGWDTSGNCYYYGTAVGRYAPFEADYTAGGTALPKYPSQGVTGGDSGLVLVYNPGITVDGVSSPYLLSFKLQGSNLSCKLSGLVTGDGSGDPLKFITWGYPNSGADNGGATTVCVIRLPN